MTINNLFEKNIFDRWFLGFHRFLYDFTDYVGV
jgi:hypothetical protein